MEKEIFNPSDEKYKKVEDLPVGHQDKFAPEAGGGFVRAEAKEKFEEAEKIAKIANIFSDVETPVSDVLMNEALTGEPKRIERERMIDCLKNGGNCLQREKEGALYLLGSEYEELTQDVELMRSYIKNAPYIEDGMVKFFPLELRSDRDLMLDIQKRLAFGIGILEYASPELRSNKEFALKMIEESSYNIEGASTDLLMDDDILLAAVRGGNNLEYIPEEKKRDKEFLLKAVSAYYNFYRELPKEMRDDLDIVYNLVESILNQEKKRYKEIRERNLNLKNGDTFLNQETYNEKQKTEELVDKEAEKHAKRELVSFIKNNLSEEVKKKLSDSAHSLNYMINTDSPIL